MKYDIFISYKRKSLPTANNLYYRLTMRGYSTFFDLEEMGRDNFNIQLLNYIENVKDVFVILEEGSLVACKSGDWEKDWFCREIAFALEKKKNIIPILIGGYKMPTEDSLPDKLKELSYKNAPEFNYSFFEAYLDKLIEKDYLLSKPNIQDKSTSVFKFYSNENCQVFMEGKLVCSLIGMSDVPYYLPVPRKGEYRFKIINDLTAISKTFDESIDTIEEKNIDIKWDNNDTKDQVNLSKEGEILLSKDFCNKDKWSHKENVDYQDIDIPITIVDRTTPIAIFVGPPAAGKTMTIIRLAKYIIQKGYTISADHSFRPQTDTRYSYLCEHFVEQIYADQGANSNGISDCTMISIRKKGEKILQCIDVPGECFSQHEKMPSYFYQIVNSINPKILIIVIEPKWYGGELAKSYIKTICHYRNHFRSSDKIIILINKVDTTCHVHEDNRVEMKNLISEIRNYYPGIIEVFRNTNRLTHLFRKYNCDILPFHTGMFIPNNSGDCTFIPSSDYYPQLLWNSLIR